MYVLLRIGTRVAARITRQTRPVEFQFNYFRQNFPNEQSILCVRVYFNTKYLETGTAGS